MKTVYIILTSAVLTVGLKSTGSAQDIQLDHNDRSEYKYEAKDESLLLSKHTVQNRMLDTELFYSENILKVENDFVIPSGKSVHIISSTEIFIGPGFEAQAGSDFIAEVLTGEDVRLLKSKTKTKDNLLTSEESSQLSVFPNPAVSSATVEYSIMQDEQIIDLKLYDIAGNLVSTLLENQRQKEGKHQNTFDISHLPNGIYYYRLETDALPITRKLVVSR